MDGHGRTGASSSVRSEVAADLLSRTPSSLPRSGSSLSQSWSPQHPDPSYAVSISRQLKMFLEGNEQVLTFSGNSLNAPARRLILAKADAHGLSHSTYGPPNQRVVRLQKDAHAPPSFDRSISVPTNTLHGSQGQYGSPADRDIGRPRAGSHSHSGGRPRSGSQNGGGRPRAGSASGKPNSYTGQSVGFRPRSSGGTPPQYNGSSRQQQKHHPPQAQKTVCRPLFAPNKGGSGGFSGAARGAPAGGGPRPQPTCMPYRQPKGPASDGRGFGVRSKGTTKC